MWVWTSTTGAMVGRVLLTFCLYVLGLDVFGLREILRKLLFLLMLDLAAFNFLGVVQQWYDRVEEAWGD